MPTNQIYKPGYQLAVAPTNPLSVVAVGDPVRYGYMTGIALTLEGAGGNSAGVCTVDFGPGVWDLSVTDHVGGGIAVGDALFYVDGAPGTIKNDSAGYFFGFALETVGAGATSTINVLHVPAPGSGTLGAGTIATANLANGILSADAAGRGKVAANFFDEATVLATFAADSIDNAELLKIIKNGAFLADAATCALFADGIWTAAKLAAAILSGTQVATVADGNLIGGIPVLHRLAIAAGVTADVDFVLTYKTRIIDAWLVKTNAAGGGAGTIQLKNGINAITDAMSININDQAIARAATIDDVQHEIAAGGTLRITRTRTTSIDETCTVYVLGVRVA